MLGTRLKELRNTINLTQEEVAKKLRIPRGTYAHYELDKRQPDNETLLTLANFFNVSIDYLLGRVNNQFDKEILALDSLENLTMDDLKLIKSLIQNLRDKNIGKK